MKVLQAIICEGTYNEKPYRSGRLLVGKYEKGALSPAWVQVQKCSVDVATEFLKKTPCDAMLYYDNYKNVIGYKLD